MDVSNHCMDMHYYLVRFTLSQSDKGTRMVESMCCRILLVCLLISSFFNRNTSSNVLACWSEETNSWVNHGKSKGLTTANVDKLVCHLTKQNFGTEKISKFIKLKLVTLVSPIASNILYLIIRKYDSRIGTYLLTTFTVYHSIK